mgnify:CR=1 FL=1
MENVFDRLEQMITAEYKSFEKEMLTKPAWEVFDHSFEIEYFKKCYNYIISQIGYKWTEEYLGEKDIAFFEKLMEHFPNQIIFEIYLSEGGPDMLFYDSYKIDWLNGDPMDVLDALENKIIMH